jgi:flavin reductase (DIM6/NTAB) family NADH-FMN oxidoreductase RutF
MFYEPRAGHGLPHNPFKALIAPRPIGWFTTLNADGTVNLAPFSYFNAVGDNPPVLMFSASPRGDDRVKDTARNAEAQGEFVHHVVPYDLRDAMNASSAAVEPGVDEAALAGLELTDSAVVAVPRLAAAPVAMECRTLQVIDIAQNGAPTPTRMILGEVVGVHIDDALLVDGRVDTARLRPTARLGYFDYAVVDDRVLFQMTRPEI